jgi:hypothetical protein
MILTAAALAVSAAFAGAAFYINVVEQPARLALDDGALLAEWKPAYRRGTLMQAPLALSGLVLGISAWQLEQEPLAALGALLAILPWPITFFLIARTNTRLTQTPASAAGAESRALVRKWGRLHALRTLASVCACAVFLTAIAT